MQNKMRFQFCYNIRHKEHAMAQFIQQTNLDNLGGRNTVSLLPFAILMLYLCKKNYYSVKRIFISFRKSGAKRYC